MCRSRIGNNAYVPQYWCGSQIWRECIKSFISAHRRHLCAYAPFSEKFVFITYRKEHVGITQ